MIRYCQQCGDPLPDNDRRRKYCSPQCQHDARNARRALPAPHALTCHECGTSYHSIRPDSLYCSRKCLHRCIGRQRRKDGRKKSVRKPAPAVQCRYPGCTVMIPPQRYKPWRYCPKHVEQADKERRAVADRRRKLQRELRLLTTLHHEPA